MKPLAGARRVAVTGAGGFIGRRLAELLEESGAETLRIARRSSPLDDAPRLAAALDGCTALVHCAFDAYDEAANLSMAETLGRVCADSGTRLVHLSTAAVYEPLPDGVLTEAAATDAPGSAYKMNKRAIEHCLLDLVAARGLDLVILQPAIVYGPAGGAWTDSPVRELLTSEVWLPDAGRGLCNAVHVDDVCRAAMTACDAVLPSGERLLVSGPAPVTWLAFLGAYQMMLGTDSLRLEPQAAAPIRPPPHRLRPLRGCGSSGCCSAGWARLSAAGSITWCSVSACGCSAGKCCGRREPNAPSTRRAATSATARQSACSATTRKSTSRLVWRPRPVMS